MKKINRDFFTNVRKTLKKSFKKKKVWIPIAAACACAVTVGAVYSNVRSVQGDDTSTTVQSATATTGTLTNSIEGTGTLAAGEGSSIEVPADLTYDEVSVSAGDTVNAGDVLATVNHESILAKMEEIQTEISTIDSEMETAKDDDSEETVTAGVSGTITAVYVSEGDDITSAMTEYGAIIQIAIGGDTEQIVSVTATEGTVASLSVAAGDSVDSGDTLCTLTLDGYSLEYQQLAEQRSTLVSELQTLIQIAQTDTITATESGTIASVGITAEDDSTTDSSSSTSDSSGTTTTTTTTSASGTTSAVNALYSETSDSSAVFATCVTYTALTDSNDTESTSSESATDSSTDTVTTSETASEQEISFALASDGTGLDLAAPETGATPQTEIAASDGSYMGTVTWSPSASEFASGTVYTAYVTLTASDGYCFTDDTITGTDYSYEKWVSDDGDEMVLAITFPETSSESDSSSTSSTTTSSSTDSSTSDETSESSTGTASASGTSSGTSGSSGSSSSGGSSSSSGGSSSGSASSSSTATSTSDTSTSTSDTTTTSTDTTDTESDLVEAFTMMSNDTMSLEVSVDELDINDVAEDQSAEVTLDAIEDETFEGTVTDVDETATSSGSGSAKYTVTISIPKEDDMKVGMSASATIAIEESDENSILIPVNAIQEEGNSTYVYTSVDADGNLSGKTEVQTGLSDGSQVVITDGLSKGDTVYYEKTGNVSDSSSSGGQQSTGMPDMSGGNGMSGGTAPSGNMPSGAPAGNTGNSN